jgi:hypothetical protein
MTCCGRTRSSLSPISQIGTRGDAAAPDVLIRYLAHEPVQVGGPASGRQYRFSGTAPVLPVDVRDATALLRTRYFRPA